MNENNLLPCPFCGGEAIIENGTNGAAIACSSCGCSTKYYEDIPDTLSHGGMFSNFRGEFHVSQKGEQGIFQAITAWNKRTCSCKKNTGD